MDLRRERSVDESAKPTESADELTSWHGGLVEHSINDSEGLAVRISRQQRRQARELARESWVEAGRDQTQARSSRARSIFESKAKARGIDPATLFLLLQIALQLWSWWQKNNIDDPSVVESEAEYSACFESCSSAYESDSAFSESIEVVDFGDEDTIDIPPPSWLDSQDATE